MKDERGKEMAQGYRRKTIEGGGTNPLGTTGAKLLWAMAGVGIAALSPWALPSQERDTWTDVRSQAYATADLAAALFPATRPQVHLLSVGPRLGTSPAAERSRVALSIAFAPDSDEILPMYHAELDRLGAVLTQHAHTTVEIHGYTDDLGTDEYNQALSLRRAESVKRYLVQHCSIAPERLSARGRGKSRFRWPKAIGTGRQWERRVEVVYVRPE
jgi:outer membrane protein OmpA-like peptidoglycan-associated protein